MNGRYTVSPHLLPYSETNHFSTLILDYLSTNEKVKEFYEFPPSIDSFAEKLNIRKKHPVNRELIADILQKQYASLAEIDAKVLSNINSLRNENTFTVTTGHQLCLFTGPLYFIYKIYSTINLAETLKQRYPDEHFVPVYWMHTEDHDFEEINHIHLFGKKIEWKEEHDGIAGNISTASLAPVLDELKKIIGDSKEANELYEVFTKAYSGHTHLAGAMCYLVNRLFGKYGLVILDPNERELKAGFTALMKDDVFNNTGYKLVNETNLRFSEHYKTQVNPREINLFYIGDNFRRRIEKSGDTFKVLGSDVGFSHEELNKELEQHPERFSPNVVLRPLFQEMILPNLAYIGGGGEIAYWLQYKRMFDYHNISFPILVLRNSVMLIDKSGTERMNKLGLSVTKLFGETDSLINSYVKHHSTTNISLNEEREALNALYKGMAEKAAQTNKSIAESILAELSKQLKYIEQVEDRIMRSEKKSFETSVNQIRKLKEKLFPQGELQERYENFIPYYLAYGNSFFELLKEYLQPFENKFMVFKDAYPSSPS